MSHRPPTTINCNITTTTETKTDAAPHSPLLPSHRYQSNKSLLVIQEATRNDFTAIPRRLLDYIIDLQRTDQPEDATEKKKEEEEGEEGGEVNTDDESEAEQSKKKEREKQQAQRWCTAREQAAWIITQLDDIVLTRQTWRMMKVNFLLHGLLWKGSRVFIEEFHKRLVNKQLHLFDFAGVLSWRQVPQENPTGAELPSVFESSMRATQRHQQQHGHDGPHASGGEHRGGKEDTGIMEGAMEDSVLHHSDLGTTEEETIRVRAVVQRAWTWKGEDNSDDNNNSPTSSSSSRELHSGEGLQSMNNAAYAERVESHVGSYMAYLESLLYFRYEYPQADLVRGVLYDVGVRGEERETQRLSAQQLKDLVAATAELLKSTGTNCVDAPIGPVGNMIVLFRSLNARVLYSIGAQALTSFLNVLVRCFLEVLRLADRQGLDSETGTVVDSLPSLTLSASDLFRAPKTTPEGYAQLAPRQKLALLAREWYTTFYQFNRTAGQLQGQYSRVREMIGTKEGTPDWLHALPTEMFEKMKMHGSLHPSRNTCPWCCSEEDTPSCHPTGEHRVPLCALQLVQAWHRQVENVHSLFQGQQKPPKVLKKMDATLTETERRFADAPTSSSATIPITTVVGSPTTTRSNPGSSAFSGTYLLRHRKGSDVSFMTKREDDAEVMYFNELMGQTSESIEALLQEDDVVVVCPDDFSATDRLKLVDRFVVLKDRPLGEGTYGKVFRAWDELKGSYLAAKEVPLDNSKGTSAAVRDALHEYNILTQLHHDNVVAVKAFMVAGSVGTIFMEWMPSGSLQEVLRSNPRGHLREAVVARYMRDALRGLEYLHSRDIMHRDVKPANMLLGTDGSVKLTDFGNSFVMAEGGHTVENGTITGTAPYMAPECAQGFYSPAGDLWSLGCTAVELLSGFVPWSDPVTGARPETIALIFRIGMLDDEKHKERPHTLMWARMLEKAGAAGLSSELRSFLDAILVVDRHARPTATQLLEHPFILKFGAEM